MATGVPTRIQHVGTLVAHDGLSAVIKRASARLAAPMLALPAAARLCTLGLRADSLDELVDTAFEFNYRGVTIKPGQVRSEIKSLLAVLENEPPRRILEIGTQHGGTMFLFAHVSAPNAQIISIDLPNGEFGGGYPAWRAALYRRFGCPGQTVELIRGDSHAETTFERVKRALAGERLDFMFIDGDHTYDGVRLDLERYETLVRPGGVIAIHDIAPPRTTDGESLRTAEEARLLGGSVPRFWREVRERCATTEFQDSELGYYGIGIVHVPEEVARSAG